MLNLAASENWWCVGSIESVESARLQKAGAVLALSSDCQWSCEFERARGRVPVVEEKCGKGDPL
eukprot:XP_001708766.1 Hypothetical protein GL50803_114998 [Giardia lamblia ATCC 50803]